MTNARALWVEIPMAILALIAIWLAILPESSTTHAASIAIWMVFAADYAWGLARAPDRSRFFRQNLADLIAVLPWDFLRAARLVRLVRVVRFLRGFEVLGRTLDAVSGILGTNGLTHALGVVAFLIVAAGLFIHEVEPQIGSVADGIWWSLVTATTVGYGDISPKTQEGRVIAAILMLVGIGTIGMVTGSITTYFIGRRGRSDPHVRHIQQ